MTSMAYAKYGGLVRGTFPTQHFSPPSNDVITHSPPFAHSGCTEFQRANHGAWTPLQEYVEPRRPSRVLRDCGGGAGAQGASDGRGTAQAKGLLWPELCRGLSALAQLWFFDEAVDLVSQKEGQCSSNCSNAN